MEKATSGPVGRFLSRTMVGSAAHAWAVVGLVALITTGSVLAILAVEPNVETDIQAGYFATHDETANAFRDLRASVAGLNSEIVYFELERDARDPHADALARQTGDDLITNVTDRAALEAQDELFRYVKERFLEITGEDKVISYTGLPYFVKLVYNAYPQGCFCFPPTEPELQSALEILYAAGGESPHLYHSDDWRSAVIFIVYDPAGNKKATAGLINELVAEYREAPLGADNGKSYDIWKEEFLDSWGAQSWIYRIDESVAEDTNRLLPIVFLFLAFALIAAFRDVKRAIIGTVTVGIILVWTLALMTVADVAIGFISMAMFPLLLGVGVDYIIHIVNEYSAERAEFGDHTKALAMVGGKGAVALLVTTLTTVTGFLVMMSSTSPMIVEIGFATVLGIFFVFILAVTFVPAMLTLTGGRRDDETHREVFRPSHAVERLARWVAGHRVLVALLLVTITGVALYYIPKTEHVIGTVEINLPSRPEKSHMLVMYERFQDKMNATGQEFVIQQGDMTSPAVMDEIIGVHRAMAGQAEDFGGSPLSLPFVINLYEVLKDGIQSAGPAVGQDVVLGGSIIGDQTPFSGADPDYQTDFSHVEDLSREEIERDLDAMWNDPVWTSLVRTFVDEQYSITWTLTFVTIPISQEATVQADEALAGVVQEVDPDDSEAHYFGTLTGVKRYNDYTDFWLFWSSVAAFAIVTSLVGLFTRRWQAVAAVALPMSMSFIWWAGALPTPMVDIDIAFVFLIPIAFITSLGSDYAVHMIINFERTGDRPWVYRTVGKAILYSAFTTGGAFLIFTRGSIRGSWEMFEASVVAILVITVTTLLAMPLIYRLAKDPADDPPVRTGAQPPASDPDGPPGAPKRGADLPSRAPAPGASGSSAPDPDPDAAPGPDPQPTHDPAQAGTS